MALAKHKVTGRIVDVPEHYLTHPVLGKNLIGINDEVQAAPKKENKKAPVATPVAEEIQEQPAPETNIEENDEELEDGN